MHAAAGPLTPADVLLVDECVHLLVGDVLGHHCSRGGAAQEQGEGGKLMAAVRSWLAVQQGPP
jgi:hypothetical protein